VASGRKCNLRSLFFLRIIALYFMEAFCSSQEDLVGDSATFVASPVRVHSSAIADDTVVALNVAKS
jgi:hypothetical protein